MGKLRLRKYAQLYLMVLPTIAYFLIFSIYPIIQGVITSTQKPRLLGGGEYVGLANYRDVLQDRTFWQALTNTLVLSGGMIALGVIIPFIVAIALHEVPFAPLRKLTQTIIYTPHLFSWVVVGGIWIQVLSPTRGLVNEVIKLFGARPIHFLADTGWIRPTLILLNSWKGTGYNAVIYYAALSSLDPQIYEAATVDGASRWQKITKLTVPLLLPTVGVVFMLSAVGALRIFDQVFILRNAATTRTINVLMTYVYDLGMVQFRLGMSTAASFLVTLVGLFTVGFLRKAMRVDQTDLA
ncbi:MAG TPA: sugar ABC transporter permease [Firmicutes bacterium]|jgi:putative aldouronate transport system permease protein|nr:sugar ABC transporter permease [Bacillota bacterium]